MSNKENCATKYFIEPIKKKQIEIANTMKHKIYKEKWNNLNLN